MIEYHEPATWSELRVFDDSDFYAQRALTNDGLSHVCICYPSTWQGFPLGLWDWMEVNRQTTAARRRINLVG